MLPKDAGADDVSMMRPITLLPEVTKAITRVIANRFKRAFTEFPGVLNRAQRAFLENGNIYQCIDLVLDVFEQAKAERRFLAAVSYDVRKAYDCVQPYSVRAACKRFAVPGHIARFILELMEGATSCVRTKHGRTDPFDVLSSVRQGDPLAPILYVLVTDALHCGLETNPLYPEHAEGDGFTVGGVRVHSAGYADDTMAVSESWRGMQRKHEWVRDFFVAHHWRLNCTKTKLMVNRGHERRSLPPIFAGQVIESGSSTHSDAIPSLPSGVDQTFYYRPSNRESTSPGTDEEEPWIEGHGPDYEVRYLGLWICLDLSWAKTIAALQRTVWGAARVIRAHRLNLVQSSTLVREYCLPRLEIGLRYAELEISRDFTGLLATWDKVLRDAMHSGSTTLARARKVNNSARHVCTDVPTLYDYTVTLRVVALAHCMRITEPLASATVWERMRTARLGWVVRDMAGCQVRVLESVRGDSHSRAARTAR
jgi:hypothetical protein